MKNLAPIRFACILLAVTALFPPWQFTQDTSRYHTRRPAGYRPIFMPPATEGDQSVRISVTTLLIEWVAIGAICYAWHISTRKTIASPGHPIPTP